MIVELANHLWQSTLFALGAAALVAAFRRNRAAVRHGIWIAASVKWLVPVSWLLALGSQITFMNPGAEAAASTPQMPTVVAAAARQVTEPFGLEGPLASLPASASGRWLISGLAAIWICGFLAVAVTRVRGWVHVRRAIRRSVAVDVMLPASRVPVRATPGLLEPGVVGILRPILLIPAGIEDRLTPAEWQSLLAHESAHVTRGDNFIAAVHMVIEMVFWFHPVVWWIGARMIDERERACDEDVLARGIQPRAYAEGILKVCRLYVESPLACVAGVSGSHLANLTARIEDIMMGHIGRQLSVMRKIVLTAAAATIVAAPIVIGGVTAVEAQATPPATTAAQQSSPVGDLASVVKVIQDPTATAADRERLIGRQYSGMISVQAVRLYQNDKAVAIVMASLSGTAQDTKTPLVFMRYTTRVDDPAVQALRKDKTVRARGTLTRLTTEQNRVWADFSDFAIEESVSRR